MAIYTIWGPPHSGKTTLAIDLAYAMSNAGQSVCLISPEPYSELSARLNVNIPSNKSLANAFSATESLKQTAYKVDDLFYVLAAPSYGGLFIEEAPSEDIKKLLLMASNLFDCVLVDCPARMDSLIVAWALNLSERVITLSGSQASAVLWHDAYSQVSELSAERKLPVCVMTAKSFDYSSLFSTIGMTVAVTIPFYKDADLELASRQTLYRPGSIKGYSAAIDLLRTSLQKKGGM